MYRNEADAMLARIDSLRRELAEAEGQRDRAAALERELEVATRELTRLRQRVGELPPPRVSRALIAGGLATCVLGAATFFGADVPRPAPRPAARSWFDAIRPRCNPLEVGTALRQQPPPAAGDGPAYAAACLALAGRMTEAHAAIDRLPAPSRPHAASVVFEVAHPVADAGDDRAAGPMMELVLDYWPQNYQAMYHAGMAAFATSAPDHARERLTAFLGLYHSDDRFTRNAREVLRRLDGGPGQRPLEPE